MTKIENMLYIMTPGRGASDTGAEGDDGVIVSCRLNSHDQGLINTAAPPYHAEWLVWKTDNLKKNYLYELFPTIIIAKSNG
ncbi:hypothetical protein ACFL0Y_01555 [Patescibacteria group bacterium]